MTSMQNENEKLKDYQERYHFWTDKRISQFSFQNNIFLTISLALMGYFWKERNDVYTNLIFDSKLDIDWQIVFFFISMALLLYSVVTGLFLAISRLYDLRLTSNIVLSRKWAFKKSVPIKDEELSSNCVRGSFKNLWQVLRKYHDFALSRNEVEINNVSLQQKFTMARQVSRDIGICSWILMKNQTVSLLLLVFSFMLVLLMK